MSDNDPDAHLAGTPWDVWRTRVAELRNLSPADVSGKSGAYEAFNALVSPEAYAAGDES